MGNKSNFSSFEHMDVGLLLCVIHVYNVCEEIRVMELIKIVCYVITKKILTYFLIVGL